MREQFKKIKVNFSGLQKLSGSEFLPTFSSIMQSPEMPFVSFKFYSILQYFLNCEWESHGNRT